MAGSLRSPSLFTNPNLWLHIQVMFPITMARTNQRTQKILGLMLTVAYTNAENMAQHHPYAVNDRSYDDLQEDADYQKAQEIILNLLIREMRKNDLRIIGSDCISLDDLENVEIEEA